VDLAVDQRIIVEVKSQAQLSAIDFKQLLTYLRMMR
jgi:hypothetical protein